MYPYTNSLSQYLYHGLNVIFLVFYKFSYFAVKEDISFVLQAFYVQIGQDLDEMMPNGMKRSQITEMYVGKVCTKLPVAATACKVISNYQDS